MDSNSSENFVQIPNNNTNASFTDESANYNNTNSTNCEQLFCPAYHAQTWRFNTILYLGSGLSIISVASNALIFYALMRHQQKCHSYFLFLILWAVFDMLVSALYVPVIVLDQARDQWNHQVWLEKFWILYFAEALVLCNVALTASSYLIVTMQLERYLITIRTMRTARHLAFVRRNRKWICFGAVMLALVMKLPVYFELQIIETKQCDRLVYEVMPTPLAVLPWYQYYKFWLRNLMCTYVPFILLAYFNVRILLNLRRMAHAARMFHVSLSDHKLSTVSEVIWTESKEHVRSATRTFVLVVFTYLFSNVLNVVVTTWEQIDIDSLFNRHCVFYFVTTDLVSLFCIMACALRLPIYLYSNEQLRQVILNCFTNGNQPVLDREMTQGDSTLSNGFGGTDVLHVPRMSPVLSAHSMQQMPGFQQTAFVAKLSTTDTQHNDNNNHLNSDQPNGRFLHAHRFRHRRWLLPETDDNKEEEIKLNSTKTDESTDNASAEAQNQRKQTIVAAMAPNGNACRPVASIGSASETSDQTEHWL